MGNSAYLFAPLYRHVLPLHAVLFSLAWITAIPFSKIHLPPLPIPCKNKRALNKLALLNPTLNSTDCLKQLHCLPIHNRIIFHAPCLRSSSAIQLRQPVHKSSLVTKGFSLLSGMHYHPSQELNHLQSSSNVN